MTNQTADNSESIRDANPSLDAAERLALDWASAHSWARIVVWGEDIRGLAAAVHADWPDADVAMWNDRVGTEVPGVRDADALDDAELVVIRLPKSLSALDEWVAEVSRRFPSATVVAAGRIKHMTLRQNDVLQRYYGAFDVSRARQKSRLLIADEARDSEPISAIRMVQLDQRAGTAAGIQLAEVGGVFAAASLDIGARALLDALDALLPQTGGDAEAIDLGSGSGIVAAWLARRGYRVRASDVSRAAVAATTATAKANGLSDRIDVHWEDALSGVAPRSAELIVLNPPFHEGTTVTVDPAHRLFTAGAAALAPGGKLVTVWNSHLGYRDPLNRIVGPTEQLARTQKFTVTVSTRA